jgi:TonB family protein
MRRRRIHFFLRILQVSTAGALFTLAPALEHGQAKETTPTEPGASFTIEILTPREGVNFGDFTAHLARKVLRNLALALPESARLGERGRVVVRLELQKDGAPVGQTPTLEVSSGKKSLDKAAITAIRSSAPFERLPEAFHGSSIEIRFTFLFNLPPPAQHPQAHGS